MRTCNFEKGTCLKMFRNKKKIYYFLSSVKFIKFIFELRFGGSKIKTRVVAFSSIVGAEITFI